MATPVFKSWKELLIEVSECYIPLVLGFDCPCIKFQVDKHQSWLNWALSLRMLYDILIHHSIVTCRLCYGLCASVDGKGGGRWGGGERQKYKKFPRQAGGASPWTSVVRSIIWTPGPFQQLDPHHGARKWCAMGMGADTLPILNFGLDVSLWLMITWVVVLEPTFGAAAYFSEKVGPTTPYAILNSPWGALI